MFSCHRRSLAVVCAVAAVAALPTLALADATASLLFPIPQTVQCVDGSLPVSPTFEVQPQSSNEDLLAAALRYQVGSHPRFTRPVLLLRASDREPALPNYVWYRRDCCQRCACDASCPPSATPSLHRTPCPVRFSLQKLYEQLAGSGVGKLDGVSLTAMNISVDDDSGSLTPETSYAYGFVAAVADCFSLL